MTNDNRYNRYDHYHQLSDRALIHEMHTAAEVLQLSNQEELSSALSAFIDRYNDVCASRRAV